jgi:hypothetical protein
MLLTRRHTIKATFCVSVPLYTMSQLNLLPGNWTIRTSQKRARRLFLKSWGAGNFHFLISYAFTYVTGAECSSIDKTTPVGLEPTRGDPIGLAGRRLNRSAKVSFGRHSTMRAIRSEVCAHTFKPPFVPPQVAKYSCRPLRGSLYLGERRGGGPARPALDRLPTA